MENGPFIDGLPIKHVEFSICPGILTLETHAARPTGTCSSWHTSAFGEDREPSIANFALSLNSMVYELYNYIYIMQVKQ